MVAVGSRLEAARAAPTTVPRWRTQVAELAPAGWVFVRMALGIEWLRGGWEKLGDPGWTAAPVGKATEGFLAGAIAKSTQGRYPEVPHWFHNLAQDVFLPNTELLAYLVTFGELLVGIGLILGALTRVAAFFGVTMNATFLWAGTSSANPPMLLLGLAILLVGRRAGAYGVDGWLMSRLGALVGPRVVDAASAVILGGAFVIVAWLAWVSVTPIIWLIAALLAAVALVIQIGAKR
jgi:thiosulfate dehydrogenase [quinone] large subunit